MYEVRWFKVEPLFEINFSKFKQTSYAIVFFVTIIINKDTENYN